MANLEEDKKRILVPVVVVFVIILIFGVIVETRPDFAEKKAEFDQQTQWKQQQK